jgi:hypothetical protein
MEESKDDAEYIVSKRDKKKNKQNPDDDVIDLNKET